MIDQKNPDQNYHALEQWIREAGDYVVPSRDLRPRVIEAAKQVFWERKQTRRATFMAFAACAVWFSLQPLTILSGHLRDQINGPTIQDFHNQSLRIASQRHESPDWGLAQAILASRQWKQQLLRP